MPHIHTASEVMPWSVAGLIPYARNSRTHSEAQIEQLAASILEFGFTNPVLVDSEGNILAGHGRVMAAQRLGMTEVPTINIGWMTDHQMRAYIIADNQLALNAGWSKEILQHELTELKVCDFDLQLLGFNLEQLAVAMNTGGNFEPGAGDQQGKLDEKAKLICPNCGHELSR